MVVSTQKENHNFIFKVKISAEKLFHSLGKHDFWNLQSFLILKHYLKALSRVNLPPFSTGEQFKLLRMRADLGAADC